MQMVKSRRDFALGLVIVGIASLSLWLTRDLRGGTAVSMEAGSLPKVLGWLLLVFGAAILIQSFLRTGPDMEAWRLRPLLFVSAAIMVFAVTIESLGLFVAVSAMIIVSGFASNETKPLETIIVAAVFAAFIVSVFIYALGLPIQAWPNF